LSCLPHDFVEAVISAVQRVFAIVSGEFIRLAVEYELALSNAVSISADNRSEKRSAFQVAVQIVIAKHYVAKLTGAIRDFQGDDDAPVSYDAGFDAVRVDESVYIHRLLMGRFAEGLFFDLRFCHRECVSAPAVVEKKTENQTQRDSFQIAHY